ncbi:hypothetical protein GQ55_7G281800 [Panicum hallii var. hallii]|uniref:Uncharacterized protein n=1 Tax=Panicum hallii var. hallii TaxID=1504633 RepID=A0A2T7CZZ4_9POAL|nr:hypothetical protein GQ55_7G281800 [Panicum hallii var. hallii]
MPTRTGVVLGRHDDRAPDPPPRPSTAQRGREPRQQLPGGRRLTSSPTGPARPAGRRRPRRRCREEHRADHGAAGPVAAATGRRWQHGRVRLQRRGRVPRRPRSSAWPAPSSTGGAAAGAGSAGHEAREAGAPTARQGASSDAAAVASPATVEDFLDRDPK